ncbi:MAG TPA: recombinase family protein [Terriglobales bacterium]
MTDYVLIPAAQYLRMSTEHQQYSTENQAQCIQQYAHSHGFAIIVSYSDEAKSGLQLKNRSGLRQLLRDVTTGETLYKAILVYDVSRWGRFQDTDESAHYEFLCKSAGIPVHYCAEGFANDGSLSSSILKALKRSMAGEYSRELGVKVFAGQKRLAELGFKQGGRPGYGLRRMLVSPDHQPKQLLASGERKSITTDRVILVPGPDNEVEVVRMIYRMFLREHRCIAWITRELNRRHIPFLEGKERWSHCSVMRILSHPKYAGVHVFNRSTTRLGAARADTSRGDWIMTPGAFEAVVDPDTFAKAQKILANLAIRKSDEEILDNLRTLLTSEGRLTTKIIDQSPDTPSANTLERRFGGILQAYERIGYDVSREVSIVSARRRIRALRTGLLSKICEMFPERVQTVSTSHRHRARLMMKQGFMVSLLIARYVWQEKKWIAIPNAKERRLVTLFARLDIHNKEFIDFHVFRRITQRGNILLRPGSKPFSEGIPLGNLSQFCEVMKQIRGVR